MPRTLQSPGKGATTCSLGSMYASPSNASLHKTWVGPPASRLPLGDSTAKSPFLGYPCSLLSKPVARVPVLVSLHRAFWEPQFLEPSRSLARLWLLRSNLAPSPAQVSEQPPPRRAAGIRTIRGAPSGAQRPRAAHSQRPPPPVITAGPEWGAGGGGPGAGIRSQVRRGAHLEAGGGSGEGGPRVPRRLVPAGRAELGPSELPATVPAAHGLCGRVGARPQPLPEEVRAGPAPPGPRPRPPLPAGCGPSPGPASQRPGARPRPPLLFGLEPAPGPLGRLCLTWLSQPSRAARTPPPSPPSFRRPLPLPPPLPTAASGRLLHSISSKGYRTQPTKVHWGTKSPHGLFVSLPLPPPLPAYPPGVTL